MTHATPLSPFALDPADPLNDLRMSDRVRPLFEHVKRFVAEVVDPMSRQFEALGAGRVGAERFQYAPGQLELLDAAKAQARAQGLWNFFLPNSDTGEGLSNLDYAYIAAELGKNPMAAECLNCSAPDTGNMEVLQRVGTPQQKARWLEPLLAGEIRSSYAMTEVHHASSDARNVATSAVLVGDEWVINGEKHFITGAGNPRCKLLIVMVRTSPDAPPHQQQSMILVPKDTPGVKLLDAMQTFGDDHAARGGHMQILFDNVRVPRDHILLGEGRGFEISQLRLGPGRIHHCMRSIGTAERALDLLVGRGLSRTAFGKPLAMLGGNIEVISRARIEIEAMRLMVLKAAKAMDVLGNKEARVWVHMVKAMVPERVCRIVDEAIQIHGALGLSQKTPLAHMYAHQRGLRLADGPDAVHHQVVGRHEIKLAEGRRPA